MQSLNAMAHMNYNKTETHYYEQLFSIMRRIHLPYSATEQQFRRMVFNVVAKNCDDHTKNVSFLMDKTGKWSLSPAYDVTYAYDPFSYWNPRHLMGINGKFDNFTKKDFEKIGREAGVKNWNTVLEQVCDVVSCWTEYAKTAGVEKSLYEKIGAVHEMHLNMKSKN